MLLTVDLDHPAEHGVGKPNPRIGASFLCNSCREPRQGLLSFGCGGSTIDRVQLLLRTE